MEPYLGHAYAVLGALAEGHAMPDEIKGLSQLPREYLATTEVLAPGKSDSRLLAVKRGDNVAPSGISAHPRRKRQRRS